MRVAAVLVALFCAASSALVAAAPEPLTKVTARSMPERLLTRRLFGDLGRIMLPNIYRGHPGRRPTRPLDMLSFVTVPRAANAAGLCETQWVTVEFEPAGPLRGADTPVRPRRIDSETAYIVRDPARFRGGSDGGAGREASADAACRAIDPRHTHSIAARNEAFIQLGLSLLLSFIDVAKEGRAPAPLDCSETMVDGAPLGEARCLAEIGRLGVQDVGSIAMCEPGPPSAQCYQIYIGGYGLTLITDPQGRRVVRATLVTMIVIADERID